MSWLNTKLSRLFYQLGENIAYKPKCFIALSVFVSLVLSAGLFHYSYINDLEHLYTVMDGESGKDRTLIEHYFPPNYTARFDPSRATRILRFARVIIMEKEEKNILNSSAIWDEIEEVDAIIKNLTIVWKSRVYNYGNLCAKWYDECLQNDQLELGPMMSDIEKGNLRLSYPVMFNTQSFKTVVFPLHFGGLDLSTNSSFRGAKGIFLNYILAVDDDEENARGKKWEEEFISLLDSKDETWKRIKVYRITFNTFTVEMEKNFFSMFKPFLVTVLFAGAFTIFTTSMMDCVKAKPLLGIAGIIASILGTSSAFGFLCLIGVPQIGINIAIPVIMLGIGVDDMFVMLAAWRRTSVHDPVPKRMAECYADAAISITITSITDSLSFYVGMLTPILSVQIFSAYAGTAVVGIYLWNVFFFGGALAISGFHEAENKHCIFWWIEATPKSKSGGLSLYKKMFFTGGIDWKEPHNSQNDKENGAMIFFRDIFAPFICNPIVKFCIFVTFIGYLGVSIWGLSMLKEGLEEARLVRYDSYMTDFFDKDYQFFRGYPHRYQIVVSTPLDYSSKENQKKIESVLHDLTSVNHMTSEYSDNWLRSYTNYLENYREFLDFNVTNEQEFINVLRTGYLNEKSIHLHDVVFNEEKTKIIASRYVLQNKNMWNSEVIKNVVADLRRVAREQWDKNGLQVTIYHPWLHFVDQYLIIRDLTVKLVIIAAAIVMVVTVVLIPSFPCALCVFFSIASIEVGVLGFMSLWGVNLDIISIVCIIMCIGFSVDFSAHITFAYISSEGKTPEERIRAAMHCLGFPIIQGSTSTIIGIIALLCVPSYAFHSNFKILFLVIIFATWHGLFLLPVLLMILKPENYSSFSFGFNQKSFNLEDLSEKTTHSLGFKQKCYENITAQSIKITPIT